MNYEKLKDYGWGIYFLALISLSVYLAWNHSIPYLGLAVLSGLGVGIAIMAIIMVTLSFITF